MQVPITIADLASYYKQYWPLYYSGTLEIKFQSEKILISVDTQLVLSCTYQNDILPPNNFHWKKISFDRCWDNYHLEQCRVYTSTCNPIVQVQGLHTSYNLNFNYLEATVLPLLLYQELSTDPSFYDKHLRFSPQVLPNNEQDYLRTPSVDLLNNFFFSAYLRTDIKESKTKVHLSHDIDRPLLYLSTTGSLSLKSLIRSFKSSPRKSILFYIRYLLVLSKNRFNLLKTIQLVVKYDPYWNFHELLTSAQSRKIRSVFYLLHKSRLSIDSDYTCSTPLITNLIVDILTANCIVGTHLSYNAPYNRDLAHTEINEFTDAIEIIASSFNKQVYNRDHYLRFSPLVTPSIMAAAGITVDSSIGFSQISGFRAGTTRPFYLYDYLSRSVTPVLELPLCIMDNTLFGKNSYSCANDIQATEIIQYFLSQAKSIEGSVFSILFHNSSLTAAHNFQRKTFHNFLDIYAHDKDLVSFI